MKPHPRILGWDHNGHLVNVCDCNGCKSRPPWAIAISFAITVALFLAFWAIS